MPANMLVFLGALVAGHVLVNAQQLRGGTQEAGAVAERSEKRDASASTLEDQKLSQFAGVAGDDSQSFDASNVSLDAWVNATLSLDGSLTSEATGGGCATRRVSSYCAGGQRRCCCRNNGLWASCRCRGHVASCCGRWLQSDEEVKEQEQVAEKQSEEQVDEQGKIAEKAEEEEEGAGCATRRVSSYCVHGQRRCCCHTNGLWVSCQCHGHVATCR